MCPGSVGEGFRVEGLGDLDGRGEDTSLDDLQLGVFANDRGRGFGAQLSIDLLQGKVQLSSDSCKLRGLEVVVLENQHER